MNKELLKKSQSLLALFALCLVITLLSDKFMTTTNLWNVLRQISVNVCISVGMTLVVLMAGIDLSVGSVLAFSSAVCAGLLKSGLEFQSFDLFVGFTVLGGVLVALLVGLLMGLFNGFVITKFSIPPFVATLAMLTIARGATMLYTKGIPISNLGSSFEFIGSGWLLGIPLPVWISLIVVLVMVFVTKKTTFGRYIYAIGGNEKAAFLSGINVNRVKLWVYGLAGTMAAIGGVLVTSRLNSAQPNAGVSYELDSIAAVVIGGTSLSGGVGTVTGTVIGAAIIGVLNNGLVLLDVSPFWQQVVKGGVILLAVIIDRKSKGSK
ncbi:ABC transporter permease [Jiulongibacter sediminis]|uniref:Ribose ABC transporter permease n=1 Tax=Jiulongibacter sediminis TaxID=1605367 RepID=A0A0P7BAE3_9BACT|nr:ribose ABC transporter permease [Jiulongibacter sediminis]KPM47333.1 ribose ABC transporter permease [Jiulongibacter sediminis]TBX22890.1 ribose ABC transporter permease [Jiulongibacter sediminis]